MPMTWEYIAGFTDGEGYIGIIGRGPRITIGQKDRNQLAVIKEFLEAEGFHPTLLQRKPKREHRQPNGVYVLTLGQREEVKDVLVRLLPSLVLKAPTAKRVIEWINANPSRKNRSELDYNEFKRLWEQGLVQRAIAAQMNCCPSKVWKFAKEHGFSFSPGGKHENGKRVTPMTADQYRDHRNEKEKFLRCPGCGAAIYRGSERCASCALTHRHQTKPQSFGTSSIGSARTARDQ